MTLAAMFATPDYVLAVSDCRRTNLETGEFLDDCVKVRQLNDALLVGYSGLRGPAEVIIEEVARELGAAGRIEKAAALFAAYIRELQQVSGEDRPDVTFLLAGLADSGRIELCRISVHEGFQVVRTEIPGGAVRWDVAFAYYDPGEWLNDRFRGLSGFPIEYVKRTARKLVKHVAKRDRYVSPQFKLVSLKLGR